MNLTIIYEDSVLLVCEKPAGLAVQSASIGRMDLESMVRNYLAGKEGKANPELAVIHRLDQPVQGLIVFAKTKIAAAELNRQVQDGRMEKEYTAVVCGKLPQQSGTLTNYLKKEPKGNCSKAVSEKTPGAQKAVLDYEVQKEENGLSLVKIHLHTGRHHQIRVQFAAAGAPLFGDTKYNPAAERGSTLALCASRLSFVHPKDGKRLEFTCEPKNFPTV